MTQPQQEKQLRLQVKVIRQRMVVLNLGSLLALTSCGGGTMTTSPAAPSAPAVSSQVVQQDRSAPMPADLSAREAALLAATNAARAKGYTCAATATEPSRYFLPGRPVTWSKPLAQAARDYAVNMAQHQFFDHSNNGGQYGPADFTKRAEAAGYTHWNNLGENLAMMSDTFSPEEVVQSWLDSTDGHCQTLLDPALLELGVGVAQHGHVLYWVQEFGSR